MHELSFAKITILREDIAEVIINEGIEMNSKIVEQFHHFLFTYLTTPFAVVINKKKSYSYNFDALQELGSLNELRAIAIITYSEISKLSTETVISMPRSISWNSKIFQSRGEAISWVMKVK